MEGPLAECDWKYMRSIHDEMLHCLCAQINAKAAAIATDKSDNPHKQYLKLYRYIHEADNIVAECFNDWRRSTISIRILSLRRHFLLLDTHVANMSDSVRSWLKRVEEMK